MQTGSRDRDGHKIRFDQKDLQQVCPVLHEAEADCGALKAPQDLISSMPQERRNPVVELQELTSEFQTMPEIVRG